MPRVGELTTLAPRDRLIVALDTPEMGDARRLVERIGDSAVFYKVGMELAYGGGLPLASELAAAGKQVFLDLKLHDIPNTVERSTAQAVKLGARFLTVHAYPQTMRAAVAGAKGSGMQILAVTVLTSYDDADLFDAVYRFGVVETVRWRAEQALRDRERLLRVVTGSARVGLVVAGEHLDEGRLAGAILPDQGVDLPVVNGEVHAGQRGLATKGLGESSNAK